jgi:hypothetical protein
MNKTLLIAVAAAVIFTGTNANAERRPVGDATYEDMIKSAYLGDDVDKCFMKILRDSVENKTDEGLEFELTMQGVRFWDASRPDVENIICGTSSFRYTSHGVPFEYPYRIYIQMEKAW